MLNKFGGIDMGIALCHIAEESDEFHFSKEANPPAQPERDAFILELLYKGRVQSPCPFEM